MKKTDTTNDIAQKKQIKRLFLWVIIMALVCAVLAASVLIYYFAPRDYDTYILTVPSLVGMDEKNIGSYDGVEIKREWIYSDEVEKGRVISQTPYANARKKIKEGASCSVTVYVSLGEQTETVPALEGVDQMSAAAALRSIGARVRSVAIYGDGEDGIVIGTFPERESEIKVGDTVTVFVSRRRVKTPVSVPDFIGMEKSEAVRLAISLGLYIGEIDDERGDVIVAQSIPDGSRVLCGSYISFRTEKKAESERAWPPLIE